MPQGPVTGPLLSNRFFGRSERSIESSFLYYIAPKRVKIHQRRPQEKRDDNYLVQEPHSKQ